MRPSSAEAIVSPDVHRFPRPDPTSGQRRVAKVGIENVPRWDLQPVSGRRGEERASERRVHFCAEKVR